MQFKKTEMTRTKKNTHPKVSVKIKVMIKFEKTYHISRNLFLWFIQDYPTDLVWVCIVYFFPEYSVDDIVLVVAICHLEWYPSRNETETGRWQPAVLHELVYNDAITQVVCVFVGVEVAVDVGVFVAKCRVPL